MKQNEYQEEVYFDEPINKDRLIRKADCNGLLINGIRLGNRESIKRILSAKRHEQSKINSFKTCAKNRIKRRNKK